MSLSNAMTTEVVPQQPTALAERDQATDLLQMIADAARDPRVDIEKMKALLEMRRVEMARIAETEFMRAFKAAQEEIGAIARDAKNEHTQSRYARLETIVEQVRPIITRHGFSISFNSPVIEAGGGISVSCTVFHEMGHSRDYHLGPITPDSAGAKGTTNKTPIQALGSTVSYLRRYLLLMIWNLVLTNEDNDGQALGAHVPITQEQADTLNSIIAELGMDVAAVSNFLTMMEAKTVSDIRADRYRQATIMLDARRRRMGGK